MRQEGRKGGKPATPLRLNLVQALARGTIHMAEELAVRARGPSPTFQLSRS